VERAIFARHAESEFSVLGSVNGDPSVPVDLTPDGVHQARRLGRAIAGDPLDLCVVTQFLRTRRTADLALEGRAVPRAVIPELDEPDYGEFEGRTLDEYRAWLDPRGSSDKPPGSRETRLELVRRYARGFRLLLARPERRILVVLHSLPLAYLLGALEGRAPAPRMKVLGYAEAWRVSRAELEGAVERIDAWCRAPTW
jgi:2,3-bisphosphoglycerate-dependent phosphoglycerate mutase